MTWILKAREAIKNSSESSSIYIGADSVRFKKGYDSKGNDLWFARHATVIIVHKDSCKGASVAYNVETIRDYGQLRTRLLREVQYSIEAFDAIQDLIGNRHLEIHLDVNPDPMHASNLVAKEAAGWVMGLGITAKIKNEAWAASTAADYCARGRVTWK
jgi:uncharacterized protein